MQSRVLLSVDVVTDDETGIWSIGELEHSLHLDSLDRYYAPNPEKRKKLLADYLRFLANYITEGPQIGEAPSGGQMSAQP